MAIFNLLCQTIHLPGEQAPLSLGLMQWLFGDSLIGAIVDDLLFGVLILTPIIFFPLAIDRFLFDSGVSWKWLRMFRFFYDTNGKLLPGFKWRFIGLVVGIPLVITVTEHYDELRELFFGA